MRTKKIITLMLLPMLFAWGACMEQEDFFVEDELRLPELSQEGKQYLACYVNGDLFLSRPNHILLAGGFKPMADIYHDSILFIDGVDSESLEGSHLGLSNVYNEEQRIYDLKFSFTSYFTFYQDNSSLGGNQYTLLESEPHQMEIHYEDENIIAGTFYFSAVSPEGDTVRITDGRFDLKKGL